MRLKKQLQEEDNGRNNRKLLPLLLVQTIRIFLLRPKESGGPKYLLL